MSEENINWVMNLEYIYDINIIKMLKDNYLRYCRDAYREELKNVMENGKATT